MKRIVVGVIAVTWLATTAGATPEPKAPPAGRSGNATGSSAPGSQAQMRVAGQLYIGDTAPDFELPSSRDRDVTLSRQRGDWLLMVFVSDRDDFGALSSIYEECGAIGVRIFGMCRDNPQSLRSTGKKLGIPFEMLADPTGEISSIYGLYDGLHRTCVPGFVVVDRLGVVKLVVSGQQVPARQILELTRLTVEPPESTAGSGS
jgi:peroxiredoxin